MSETVIASVPDPLPGADLRLSPETAWQVAHWTIPRPWKALTRMRVYGADRLPRDSAYVLASNHLSWSDPFTVGMLVAKDDVVTEMDKAFAEQGVTGDFSAEDAYGFFVFALVVLTLWCIIACVLAVFAMRGSKVSRILLVISSGVAGLLSLVAIGSVISAVWLLACIAVVILFFTGGAGEWYQRRRGY